MRYVALRYWVGLGIAILLLLSTNVAAQKLQVVPDVPPPHIAECMALMEAYGNYIVMRNAEITQEEANYAFDISLKLGAYLLKQKGLPQIPVEQVAEHRYGIALVYGLPVESLTDNNALRAWVTTRMKACVADKAPEAAPEADAPAPARKTNRMIPS